MLALMIILMGLMVFLSFISICAIMFNATIKKCSLHRDRTLRRDKFLHNMYTMAYSAIFSTMLIASVCFPAFASSYYRPIDINIPTIQSVFTDSAKEIVNKIQNEEGINIFSELNDIYVRFENEDVFGK